jgi:hypothetical protein
MSLRANLVGLRSACMPSAALVAFFLVRRIPVPYWMAYWPVFACGLLVAPMLYVMTRDAEEIRLLKERNNSL